MNPGVRPVNIFSLLLSHFIVMLIMTLETAFTSYLLKDNYDIHGDRVAEVAGNLGFVGDIGSVSMELLSGPAMDIFGRKSISIGCLMMASFAMFSKPLLKSLTGLYILKLLTNIGTVPLFYSPYPVDYVAKDSLGLFSTSYCLLVSQCALMLSTSGAIQVQKVLPVSYVYFAIGLLSFATSIFFIFGLKDVHTTASKPATRMLESDADLSLLDE